MYAPTFWDWSTFIGTIGLFVALLFLFLRFLPMISIFEMRTILPEAKVEIERMNVVAVVYGLMAEFDDPTALVAATERAHARGLPLHGRVLAVSDRGAARRARLAADAAAADRADRRPGRLHRRLRASVLGCR